MDDEANQNGASRRRSVGRTAVARSQALERLKALRNGEKRSTSYDFKLEEPIYDTVDEDEYKNIVAKRRNECGDFIVGDSGDGYIDDGEEEDWTKSTVPFSSSDDESDGGGERSKRKKKDKEPKSKSKPSAASNALSAAAANIMGKQRISSMFTTNVFKKKSDDISKAARGLNCDSLVDDVIAEFAPDDVDRERRKRVASHSHSNNLGLGFRSGLVTSLNNNNNDYNNNINNDYSNGDINKTEKRSLMMDTSPHNVGVDEEKSVNLNVRGGDLGSGFGDVALEKSSMSIDDNDGKMTDLVQAKSEMDDMKEEEAKVFALNAKIKEKKNEAFNVATELQAMSLHNSSLNGVDAGGCLNSEDKSEFVVEADGS